jgi:hypothetical protein
MANCVYCGKPAGVMRRHHPECKARHSNAFSVIPEFFGKVIDSAISAQRFSELLQAASRESFVSVGELKSLCHAGFTNVITSILNQRPLTAAELQRITELIDALGASLPDGLGLDELLAKINVVTELSDGKIPDYVSVAGPVPIEFEADETVLWIFNQATRFRSRRKSQNPAQGPAPINSRHVGPQALEKTHFPRDKFAEEATGDLLITNRNLHFLRNIRSGTKTAIADIKAVHAYAEAITLTSTRDEDGPQTFLVDDAWFAGHVIYRLSELAHGRVPARIDG